MHRPGTDLFPEPDHLEPLAGSALKNFSQPLVLRPGATALSESSFEDRAHKELLRRRRGDGDLVGRQWFNLAVPLLGFFGLDGGQLFRVCDRLIA